MSAQHKDVIPFELRSLGTTDPSLRGVFLGLA